MTKYMNNFSAAEIKANPYRLQPRNNIMLHLFQKYKTSFNGNLRNNGFS